MTEAYDFVPIYAAACLADQFTEIKVLHDVY